MRLMSQTDNCNEVKRVLMASTVLLCFAVLNIGSSALEIEQEFHFGKGNDSLNCADSCQTNSCLLYGNSMEKQMNLTADPCEDFHEFVCGKWKRQNTTSLSPTDLHQHSMFEKLWRLLMSLKNENLLLQKYNNSRAIRYVVELFHECVDLKKRKQLGVQPMRELLKQVLRLDRWSLDNSHVDLLSNEKDSSIHLFSDFVRNFFKNLTQESINSEQDFQVSWSNWRESDMTKSDDVLDVAKWMDSFVESSLISMDLNEQIFYFDKLQISLNFQETEKIEHLYKIYSQFKKSLSTLFDLKWKSSFDESIFEVLNFYKKLTEIYNEKFVKFEGDLILFQNITLGDLNAYYSSDQFNWTVLLNKFASRTGASFRFTEKDKVGVGLEQLRVLKPLTELIANTPIRVLKNSIAFQIISDSIYTSLLWDKNLTDDQHMTACIDDKNLNVYLPVFIRLLVDHLGRERMRTARDKVIEMAIEVKETFRYSLQHEHIWLDGKTRQKAVEKLDSMKLFIGFPDCILEDSGLDEEYGFDSANSSTDSLQIIDGHYAESHFNLLRLMSGALFQNSKNSIPEREFYFNLFKWAYYVQDYNFIVFSIVEFEEQLFSVDYPAEINYGSLGSIIGHEIIHAFDNKYDVFEQRGNNRIDWRTDYSSEHFEHLSNSFVFKYDGLIEPITGLKLNGTHTLMENIADNGGLRQAYRALKKHLKQSTNCTISEKPSPFLAQFTAEQLYFISYGTNYCSSYRNTSSKYVQLQTDPHSPELFRVNIPLSSMPEFTRAFNCPIGSKMDSIHKNKLW